MSTGMFDCCCHMIQRRDLSRDLTPRADWSKRTYATYANMFWRPQVKMTTYSFSISVRIRMCTFKTIFGRREFEFWSENIYEFPVFFRYYSSKTPSVAQNIRTFRVYPLYFIENTFRCSEYRIFRCSVLILLKMVVKKVNTRRYFPLGMAFRSTAFRCRGISLYVHLVVWWRL